MSQIYSNSSTSTLAIDVFYWYMVCAGLNMISYILLLVIVLSSRRLRGEKEYIMLAANFIHEIIYASAWAYGGFYRAMVYYTEKFIPLSTRADCFHSFHLFLWLITFPGGGIMMLTCSVDRLFAIIFPLKYIKFSVKYAISLMAGGYLINVPVFGSIVYITFFMSVEYRDAMVSGTCELSGVYYPIVQEICRGGRAFFTFVGVILYMPITWKTRQVYQAKGQYAQLQAQQRKKLIRYNIVVSFMVLTEIFLIVIPDGVLVLWPKQLEFIRYPLAIVTLSKSLVNVVMLIIMQRELRSRIYALVRRTLGLGKEKSTNNITVFATMAGNSGHRKPNEKLFVTRIRRNSKFSSNRDF